MSKKEFEFKFIDNEIHQRRLITRGPKGVLGMFDNDKSKNMNSFYKRKKITWGFLRSKNWHFLSIDKTSILISVIQKLLDER